MKKLLLLVAMASFVGVLATNGDVTPNTLASLLGSDMSKITFNGQYFAPKSREMRPVSISITESKDLNAFKSVVAKVKIFKRPRDQSDLILNSLPGSAVKIEIVAFDKKDAQTKITIFGFSDLVSGKDSFYTEEDLNHILAASVFEKR